MERPYVIEGIFESHMYIDIALYLRQLPVIASVVIIRGGPRGVGEVIRMYQKEVEVRGNGLSPTDRRVLFVKYVCCIRPIVVGDYYVYATDRKTELKIQFGYLSVKYHLVSKEGEVRKYKSVVTADEEKTKKIVLTPLHPKLIEYLANEELYKYNFWIKAPNELIVELNGGAKIRAVFNDGGVKADVLGQLPLTWFTQKGQILEKLGLM